MSLNDRCQEALDDLRAGKPVPNTPRLRAFLEGALEDGADGTRFLPGIREAAADIRDQPAPAGVIDREALAEHLASVRWDNADTRMDRRQFWRERADAVIAVLDTRTVAQVKAEALREIRATLSMPQMLWQGDRGVTVWPDYPDGEQTRLLDWLNARADELEREDGR